MSEISLKIQGMSCNGCLNTVKSALSELEGVKSAEVSLENASAKVQYDAERLNPDQIIKAVVDSGYTAEA